MSAGALVFTQFFRVILEFAVSYGPTSIFLALLFYTLAVVAIQLAAGRMKSRILSLPSSESTNSINIQLDRVRSYIKTRRQNHAKKEETTEGKKRF
jgi:squalene cyclase